MSRRRVSDLLSSGIIRRNVSFAAFADAQREAARRRNSDSAQQTPNYADSDSDVVPDLSGSEGIADSASLRNDGDVTLDNITALRKDSGDATRQTLGEHINTWLSGIQGQPDSLSDQLQIFHSDILSHLDVGPGQLRETRDEAEQALDKQRELPILPAQRCEPLEGAEQNPDTLHDPSIVPEQLCEQRNDAELALDMVNRIIAGDNLHTDQDQEELDVLADAEDLALQQPSLLPQDMGGEMADEDGFDDDADDPVPHDTGSLSETSGAETVDTTRPPTTNLRSPVIDTTTEVRHTASPPTLSQFATALVLWEEKHNITRQAHRELVEVPQLVRDTAELQTLPHRKDTMRKHPKRSLPLLTLRKKTLQLDKAILPSRSSLTEDMLVFDIRNVLQAFLGSISNQESLYRGMAHLVDTGIENPREARWWGESIRTTSGQHILDKDSKPLWPSDFVQWVCPIEDCEMIHLGRITWCGLDFRSSASEQPDAHKHLIEIQIVHSVSSLPPDIKLQVSNVRFSQSTPENQELIVVEDNRTFISKSQIIGRLPPVLLDYNFDPTAITPNELLNCR